MSPESKTAAARAAALLLLLSCAGCAMFKNRDEAQAVIDQRVVGMPVGDFFQQYGPAKNRAELADGATDFAWVSPIGPTPNAGYYGLDDRTCTLRIVSARNGRITVATIVQDMPGRTSTSRCGEMFLPK